MTEKNFTPQRPSRLYLLQEGQKEEVVLFQQTLEKIAKAAEIEKISVLDFLILSAWNRARGIISRHNTEQPD